MDENASLPQLEPFDEHNQALMEQVHPSDWKNPQPTNAYHLVVLGAGTAGLVTAAGAASLGARVAIVERDLMGGDCLNVGCVPSKALIASSRAAATARAAGGLGVASGLDVSVDFAAIMKRMRRLRRKISPNDSANRFKSLGVDVYFGRGSFDGGKTISVVDRQGERRQLEFRKAVIATGARASAPPISGLDSVPYLTNETIFSLTELPSTLAIIGSGPIGCEMAQAFARFGSRVVIFERAELILPREDPDAARRIQQQFEAEQIEVMLRSEDMKLTTDGQGRVIIQGACDGRPYNIQADRLLVAVGRAPNTDGLGLESVGVDYDREGVTVDDFLRTTNPKIYAAGDVCSKYKFTHAADFQARIVLQNALFAPGPFGRARASRLTIPWATYTSPEVAHVGLYEHEAGSQGIEIDLYKQEFADVDRAILDGQEIGMVKVITKKGSDQILGATIVADQAGDMISELTLAITQGVGLGAIAGTIHPYPTHAEAIRKLGDQYNRTRLTPFKAKLLNILRTINVGR